MLRNVRKENVGAILFCILKKVVYKYHFFQQNTPYNDTAPVAV